MHFTPPANQLRASKIMNHYQKQPMAVGFTILKLAVIIPGVFSEYPRVHLTR
jgi:hypothetical protein